MTDHLDDWITELATALGIDADEVDRDLLLDVARDAAHGVARPAAPITTFLIGYAAGKSGSKTAMREAAAIARKLALARQRPAE